MALALRRPVAPTHMASLGTGREPALACGDRLAIWRKRSDDRPGDSVIDGVPAGAHSGDAVADPKARPRPSPYLGGLTDVEHWLPGRPLFDGPERSSAIVGRSRSANPSHRSALSRRCCARPVGQA
jgi:hypothetical protein